jgi:hypothetical protein
VSTLIAFASSTSGASLLISLVFGVGQCVVGVALVLRAARRGRWRRFGIFVSGMLGAWAICSGLAELVVSGYALSMASGGSVAQHALEDVRRTADTSLLIASGALVLLLCVYPLWVYIAQHRTPASSPSRSIGED